MNDALPGADLIESGLNDLREGRETIAALLVAIGAPRLEISVSSCRRNCRTIQNIGCMTCWRKMILIQRIRVTMLTFANWLVTNEQPNACKE
jgi:hypothetical protein